MSNTVKIKAFQTLLDVCIETAGTINGLFDCANNNGKGITDDLIIGDDIMGLDIELGKANIVQQFAVNKPASDDGVRNYQLLGGIGYMKIGTTFIVS